jgi:DNA-methyltransferase (dcm)
LRSGGIFIKTVDLFCGCGGLSLGFQNAGFNVLAGFEYWDNAIQTYAQNFKHPVKKFDLSNHVEAAKVIKRYEPAVIIGGPPCQDFSGAGKRTEGNRASLTISFANIIKDVLPDYFVMENVERASISNAYQDARQIFKDAGYGLTEKVLDASFCGVPQKRKRFFCIGQKNGKDGFLDGHLSTNQSIFPLTVKEYFSQNDYSIGINYYYRHPRTYNRRGIFSVDEPSPTIRGVNRPKPKLYNRNHSDPVSPEGIRSLTFRERALIQTFPTDFIWNESSSITEQMIGNAVPVKLSEYVADCLMRYIKGDMDFHNIRFIDWLKKNKLLSPKVAGDTLSRVGRAKRIVQITDTPLKDYIASLENSEDFQNIVSSVQAQIKRAVKLYFEYKQVLAEEDIK